MPSIRTLCWFRQDLRLDDNPSFHAAVATGGNMLPLYLVDTHNSGQYSVGSASKVWLHHSLISLNKSLKGQLCCEQGNPLNILEKLIKQHEITHVFWNRCFEPWQIKRDTLIKEKLRALNIRVKSFHGNYLFDPLKIKKKDGSPYRVFTPFYQKGCLSGQFQPGLPVGSPSAVNLLKSNSPPENLNLLPKYSWYKPLMAGWKPGEKGAMKQLDDFIYQGLKGYKANRDFPDRSAISRLSPHLHFGEISANRLWHRIQAEGIRQQCEVDAAHYLSELGWREFSNYLLYHFPDLPSVNFNPAFNRFPWKKNKKQLMAWQQGKTGYPLVDAGMRELWQTGFMHNRVRMVCASFLVKNLMIHWKEGESWFWDTLVDADLANNSASWQWVAGSGVDAAPYFRIFNPLTQSIKFDPEGAYIRRFVPELAGLPVPYIHKPVEAPEDVLAGAGVSLGKDYPLPLVDLKTSREAALEAYKQMKTG